MGYVCMYHIWYIQNGIQNKKLTETTENDKMKNEKWQMKFYGKIEMIKLAN